MTRLSIALVVLLLMASALACEQVRSTVTPPVPTATTSPDSIAYDEYSNRSRELIRQVNELTYKLLQRLVVPEPENSYWVTEVSGMASELTELPSKSELLTKSDYLSDYRDTDELWARQYADIGTVLLIGLDLYKSGQTENGLAAIRTGERALGDIRLLEIVLDHPDYP